MRPAMSPAVRPPARGLRFRNPLVGQPQCGNSALVLLVETSSPWSSSPTRPCTVSNSACARRLSRPLPPRWRASAARHRRRWIRPGPHRLDLTRQPCESLTPIRLRSDGGQVCPLGLRRGAFLCAPARRGRPEDAPWPPPARLQPFSNSATSSASASGSGSGPVLEVCSASRYCARWWRSGLFAATRSASAESRNHVCWAASVRSTASRRLCLVRGNSCFRSLWPDLQPLLRAPAAMRSRCVAGSGEFGRRATGRRPPAAVVRRADRRRSCRRDARHLA